MSLAKGKLLIVSTFSSKMLANFNLMSNAASRQWGKIYIFGIGCLTKMAAMPIYGKNL